MIQEFQTRSVHFTAMFRELCREDPDAQKVCWAMFQFLHVLDDLVDRDQVTTPVDVGLSLLSVLETVAANPFFQANRDMLLGVLRVGVMEWVDSEQWRTREDVREKLAAEVLKSGYQNFFFCIAGLCGGIDHMQAMTAKYRQFQWD